MGKEAVEGGKATEMTVLTFALFQQTASNRKVFHEEEHIYKNCIGSGGNRTLVTWSTATYTAIVLRCHLIQ
jgi:hypothetical protein